MKKLLSAFLTIALSVMLFVPTFAYAAEDNVLRIYNWEDYIAADDETGENLADEFQTWYNETYNANITVEYSTFGTNEIMYNELKIAPGSYDLVCPSDYMIQKMINENMVEEFSAEFLDASNETSYYSKYVSSYIKNLFGKYEVNGGKSWNNYAAAYMWGTMGYVFNPANVSSSDMKSWGAIWNIMYDNQSTLKDSVRDTFFIGLAFVYRDELNTLAADYQNAVLQYNNGIIDQAQFDAKAKQYNDAISVILNRTDDETLAKVEAALNAAKQNIFGFEVDSGKNDMITGKININLAWSGDAVFAMDQADENGVELYYTVPDEGSNIWFDGWVMPKGANTKLAEAFINYISMPEKACENMDYIGYTSAIAGDAVFDRMVEYYELSTEEGEGLTAVDLGYFFTDLTEGRSAVVYTDTVGRQFSAQYPDKDTVNRCAIMSYFPDDVNEKVNLMWENVKGTQFPVWVIFVIIGAIVIGVAVYFIVKSNKGRRRPKKGYKVISKG